MAERVSSSMPQHLVFQICCLFRFLAADDSFLDCIIRDDSAIRLITNVPVELWKKVSTKGRFSVE